MVQLRNGVVTPSRFLGTRHLPWKGSDLEKDDPAYKGQAAYGPLLLAIYDVWVLKFMARYVWRSPIEPVMDMYRRNVTGKHLDIGPGTGFFLDRSGILDDADLTILDPNSQVLDHVRRRLAPTSVAAVEADVLKSLPLSGTFDSVGFSFVLHCLPGPLSRKELAFRHIASVMAPDAVMFGGTVLGPRETHTRVARMFLRVFNWEGGFDNTDDDLETIQQMIEAHFLQVSLERVGSTCLFEARGPRQPDQVS